MRIFDFFRKKRTLSEEEQKAYRRILNAEVYAVEDDFMI